MSTPRPIVPRQLYLPIPVASIKLLPTFRCTGYPGESSHEIRDSWPPSSEGTRCNASANPICAFLMPAIRLIDTRLASHKGHYVNHSVREIRPPARWRFSSPRFDPPSLRMRRIIRPRVVAPRHPIRARRDAFRRRHSAPGIQPGGDHSDTGLRPAPAPFARALPATPAGSYSQ